jgi:hypothetical protein
MGALKFIRNPLLMSLNAQMTVVLGQIFVPLQPLFPQVGIYTWYVIRQRLIQVA